MKLRLTGLLITVLFFLIISKNLYSQQVTFTIDTAIETALENNREVKIAFMNVQKADAAVSEAFGYALPSVDLTANYYRFVRKPKMPFPDFEALLTNATYGILFEENVIPRDDNKFKPISTLLQSFVQTNNYEASVQVTQTLFSSAVFRGIGSSKIYYQLAKQDYCNTVSKTILTTRQAFYGALLSKQLYEITKASLDNAEKNLRNVKALYEQGFVSEFDALQAEVQAENIRPAVLQMENMYRDTKEKLKIVMGIDQAADIEVSGEFKYENESLPDVDELVEEALKSNTGIKTLDLKMQVDDAFIDLYRAEYWPNLAAFGNFTYAGSADNWKFQNYSSATIGLGFSMNLFAGGKSKQRVEQAHITALQTEEQLKQLKDFIASEVKGKVNEIARVKSTIEAQQRNVTLAEKAYDIALVRYKEGTGSQLEIQNADMSLRQARTNLLQSIYSYKVTMFELDQLLGKIDPEHQDVLRRIEQ